MRRMKKEFIVENYRRRKKGVTLEREFSLISRKRKR